MWRQIVSWEPEGRYCRPKIFRWEPERRYFYTKSIAIVPFWFWTEHLSNGNNTLLAFNWRNALENIYLLTHPWITNWHVRSSYSLKKVVHEYYKGTYNVGDKKYFKMTRKNLFSILQSVENEVSNFQSQSRIMNSFISDQGNFSGIINARWWLTIQQFLSIESS